MVKPSGAQPQPEPRLAFPMREAAYKLGICVASLYNLRKLGKVKTISVAGRTLVPHSELVRLTSVEANQTAV